MEGPKYTLFVINETESLFEAEAVQDERMIAGGGRC